MLTACTGRAPVQQKRELRVIAPFDGNRLLQRRETIKRGHAQFRDEDRRNSLRGLLERRGCAGAAKAGAQPEEKGSGLKPSESRKKGATERCHAPIAMLRAGCDNGWVKTNFAASRPKRRLLPPGAERALRARSEILDAGK